MNLETIKETEKEAKKCVGIQAVNLAVHMGDVWRRVRAILDTLRPEVESYLGKLDEGQREDVKLRYFSTFSGEPQPTPPSLTEPSTPAAPQ